MQIISTASIQQRYTHFRINLTERVSILIKSVAMHYETSRRHLELTLGAHRTSSLFLFSSRTEPIRWGLLDMLTTQF